MKWRSFLAVGIMGVVGSVCLGVAQIRDGRCEGWGDSLEQSEVAGRVGWALKCEPDEIIRSEIETASHGLGRSGSANITPGYPSYGSWQRRDGNSGRYENPRNWFAPKVADAACDVLPPGYRLAFFCASGCYTPEQQILFGNGYAPISDAMEKEYSNVMALESGSSLDSPSLKELSVEKFLADVVLHKQDILEFSMKSGGKLRVTTNHPVLDSQGKMRVAASLYTGESLVKANGTFDPILSIQRTKYFGRVYNLNVATTDPKQQIVVAQGYLNGSLHYQNQGISDLNRVILRRNIGDLLE